MIRLLLRLPKLLVPLIAGIAIGIWFERDQMQRECAAGEGEWTGTICLNSELLQ